MGTRIPRTLFIIILLAALAEGVRDFSLLPDRMASHFATSGAPNGWMSKPQFFGLNAILIALAAAVGFLPPLLVANASPSRINLPNKEYWLAPERRAETLAFFEKQFAWFGCVFLLLLFSVMELVMQGNLSPTPQLSTGPFLLLISAFVLFTMVWSLAMLRRFSNPR
jgi:uncharacterized membrane protein